MMVTLTCSDGRTATSLGSLLAPRLRESLDMLDICTLMASRTLHSSGNVKCNLFKIVSF